MSKPNGYLGFANRPTGRFGNQLFQYYFLARFARATNSSKFHPPFLGKEMFENFGLQIGNYAASIGMPSTRLSIEQLKEFKWSDLIQFTEAQFNSGRKVILPTGILDYCFYEDQPDSIETIFRSKKKYQEVGFHRESIALHFRGTDFHNWNEAAVMDAEYYFKALDSLREKIDVDEYRIELFTDDPSHSTVKKILRYPKVHLSTEKNYLKAFLQISRSNVLVSSPSTYAYWAGVLGNKKIIINSSSWINSEIEKGDKFWMPVRLGKCKLLKNAYEV